MRTGHFIMDVVLPDIHTVSFSDLPDHFCRNTTSNAVCRYVTGDNCACCNDAVFSNRNTAADRDAGADPTAVLQRDRRCIFKIVPAVRIVCVQPFFSKKRMLRRCQSYIGADPDTVAQYNGADIKKRAVIIYKAIVSYYSTDADHYRRMLKAHQNIKKDVWFAGGLWSWTGFSPHNRFSIEASKAAIDSCKECGVKDVFLTLWGNDGAETSRFSTLPSLFYAAEYAKGNTDEATIKKKFEDKLGIAFDDFMQVEISKELCGDGTGNPEKYMLYNDCFMGIMDHTVQAGDGARFAACAAHIASFQAPREWDYLFQSMYNLYRVLEVKAELGIRTHEIYRSGDKGAIHVLICDYEETEKRLEQFYQSFRRQWLIENKAFGFEIQDIRLGGLLHRIKHCRERLQAFYDGDIRKIEELEQEQFDFFGFEKPCARPKFNSWSLNVSTNVVSCGLDVE